MSDLQDILSRLKAATGPDLTLDRLIAEAVGDWVSIGGWWIKHKVTGEEKRGEINAPAYTASLDAVVALIERVLPGWRIHIHGNSTLAQVDINDGTTPYRDAKRADSGQSRPMALALCIACLSALSAQGGGNG